MMKKEVFNGKNHFPKKNKKLKKNLKNNFFKRTYFHPYQ